MKNKNGNIAKKIKLNNKKNGKIKKNRNRNRNRNGGAK